MELSEPSDTLNYKPLFKHCILQTVLHLFLLFIFVFLLFIFVYIFIIYLWF